MSPPEDHVREETLLNTPLVGRPFWRAFFYQYYACYFKSPRLAVENLLSPLMVVSVAVVWAVLRWLAGFGAQDAQYWIPFVIVAVSFVIFSPLKMPLLIYVKDDISDGDGGAADRVE